jgi:hypothetical protein
MEFWCSSLAAKHPILLALGLCCLCGWPLSLHGYRLMSSTAIMLSLSSVSHATISFLKKRSLKDPTNTAAMFVGICN